MDSSLPPGQHSKPVTVRTPALFGTSDEWMSEASLRPPDGGDVLLLRASGSSEVDAENELLNSIAEHTGKVQTLAPDHPLVREFIEVFSLSHDLSEATEALEAADQADGDVRQMLTAHAITAYGRTFNSNVRDELTSHIVLSPGDAKTRALLKGLRNRTIAHSESTMNVTNLLLDLERPKGGDVSVARTRGLTSSTAFPDNFFVAFKQHVEHAQTLLQDKAASLREALPKAFSSEELAQLFRSPRRPRYVPLAFDGWEPDKRRPKFQVDSDQPLLMGSDGGRRGTVRVRIH